MKKLFITLALLGTSYTFAGGGAVGLQLGPVTFGLGGSSNGPIIGVGRSPDNGLPFSAVVVPGDCCDCDNNCDMCPENNCWGLNCNYCE